MKNERRTPRSSSERRGAASGRHQALACYREKWRTKKERIGRETGALAPSEGTCSRRREGEGSQEPGESAPETLVERETADAIFGTPLTALPTYRRGTAPAAVHEEGHPRRRTNERTSQRSSWKDVRSVGPSVGPSVGHAARGTHRQVVRPAGAAGVVHLSGRAQILLSVSQIVVVPKNPAERRLFCYQSLLRTEDAPTARTDQLTHCRSGKRSESAGRITEKSTFRADVGCSNIQ